MIRNKAWPSVLLLGAVVWLMVSSGASANFEECGGVFVAGDAKCEVRETEECMTECTTSSVVTSCAAKLYASCESSCTETASASCQTSCSEVCTNDCQEQTATEQPPNCMGLCVSDCQHNCDRCDGSDGPCQACCGHTCNDKCQAQCGKEPAQPTQVEECMPTCTTACTGSCDAQANVQCQIDCQTRVYTECETELVEKCETECMETGGAIFCDGQFLNAANIDNCAAELNAAFDFNLNVDFEGAANAAADGTVDTGKKIKKKTKALCSVDNVGLGAGGGGAALLVALSACALALVRTRKRRSPPSRPR